MNDSATNSHEPVPQDLPDETEARRAPQETPEATERDFEPLATCPPTERPRFERRARLAAEQPLKAIELKCLECCAWSRPEASRCQIHGCPLYAMNRRIFERRGGRTDNG